MASSSISLDLREKCALVTGAAGGLGKEFAGRLLKAGAKVRGRHGGMAEDIVC